MRKREREPNDAAAPAAERQNNEPAKPLRRDLLDPTMSPPPQAATAPEHARLLEQAAGSHPSRAAGSLLRLQRQYGNQYVGRVVALFRKQEEAGEVAPEVERAIHGASGGGQTLDSEVRRTMEPALGHDLSGVRVHTGTEADRLNRAVNARAFTTGRDIFFRDGEYRPGSSGGRELLAHELTHVAQQAGAGVQTKLSLGQPGDRYEEEADAMARAIVSREQVPARAAETSGAPGLQGRFVATGKKAEFVALCNDIITVQFTVSVNAAGEVSITSTDVQGPPTQAQSGLLDVLREVINDTRTTTIKFSEGTTTAVIGGNYALSEIDLSDIRVFGLGNQRGMSAASTLSHEIREQYRKQVHGEGYPTAHASGLAAETAVTGATRGAEGPPVGLVLHSDGTRSCRITVPYTYPDGKIVDVTLTIDHDNITGVTRVERP